MSHQCIIKNYNDILPLSSFCALFSNFTSTHFANHTIYRYYFCFKHSSVEQPLKVGRPITYLHTNFPFPLFFIPLWGPGFLYGIISYLPLGFTLTFLVVRICWWWMFSSYLLLRNLYFILLKDTPTLCRIQGWHFSLRTWKMLLHCLLACFVFYENSSLILTFVPFYVMCLFF